MKARSIDGYADYLICFVREITPKMLLDSIDRRLPWLRVLFQREGFQRSFENHDPSIGQHKALVSLQPRSDLLGHGWKAMGRLMVVPETCDAPLLANRSGTPILDGYSEASLAVEMCWCLHHHRGYASQAYKACSKAVQGMEGKNRVLVRYLRIGFDRSGKQVAFEHLLNFTEREARLIYGPQRRRQGAAAVTAASTAASTASTARRWRRDEWRNEELMFSWAPKVLDALGSRENGKELVALQGR